MSVVNLTFQRNIMFHVKGSSRILVPMKMMALCAFETSGTDHLLTWASLAIRTESSFPPLLKRQYTYK